MKIKQKQYFLFLKKIMCISEIDYFNERKRDKHDCEWVPTSICYL